MFRLSNNVTYASIILKAKELGYKIIIFFYMLKILKPTLAEFKNVYLKEDILSKQKQLKEDPPKCLSNFWNIYRPLANEMSEKEKNSN
jgi:hypothetical protein